MKKLWVLIAVMLIAAVSAVSAAPEGVSGTLPRPLRFVRPVDLGGVEARRLEVSGLLGPVAVADTKVVGTPGSVPAGSHVSILWRGVEVGRAVADADGGFQAAVPTLPDSQVSVVYGSGLPELRPWVNVTVLVPGYMSRRVASSTSYWSNCAPECAFDACVYPGSYGTWITPYGPGYWSVPTYSAAWVQQDLGREVELSEAWVWFRDATQTRDCKIWVSRDGVSFSLAATVTATANGSVQLEAPTFKLKLPEGTVARYVRIEADCSKDWTGLHEAAVLGRVPVPEILVAPGWTLPEGECFGGEAVVLVKPGSWSGHNPYYWPDADAWWIWCTVGANSSAPLGKVRFRVPFEVRDCVDALLYVAADDKVTAWFDGVAILYWQAADRYGGVPLRITPGRHVLAFECENAGTSPNPAGLLVTLRDQAGNVILRSGDPGWETSGYIQ